MPEYLVEIRFSLEAPSVRDAQLWAAEALDTAKTDDPSVIYCDVHVTPRSTKGEGDV